MTNLKNIAIIPARKNSERLPGKNCRNLGGIPLVSHSIHYAKAQKELLDGIFVTTDDPEVKKIAKREGVNVIDRPQSLSTDHSSTVSALKHVLEILGDEVENVILLQPTNPLRPRELFKNAFEKFNSGNFDSLMTVSRSYLKLGKLKNDKFLPFNYKIGQRSQDLDPLYYENGLLYISKAKLILEDKLLGENNFPFIVDHPFAEIDIDVQADLDYAEFIIKRSL